ncbi:MAG: winged helix-turn-helix transcriptional regulator [Candidatus Heimdallarchaeota archaeon]|nr:winged helix-turn-helix transcriptional regulator [Candidatus Heimdallarchaeota archaeon]
MVSETFKIVDIKVISDYEAVSHLYHQKKQLILKLLIEKEMNIISIKKATGMNPGTIKRHLDDLIKKNLVALSSTKDNNYGQKEKYYRATGKEFSIEVNFKWP